jgi:hypothetical protein
MVQRVDHPALSAVIERRHDLQVHAGAKRFSTAGENHRFHLIVLSDVPEDRGNFLGQLAVQRIGRRPPQGDESDLAVPDDINHV